MNFDVDRTEIQGFMKRVFSIGIVSPEIDDNPNHAREIHFYDGSSAFVDEEFGNSLRHNQYVLVSRDEERNRQSVYGPLEKDRLFNEDL